MLLFYRIHLLRNLNTEMYDGRMDVVITDIGRRPANSTRVPASLNNVRFIKWHCLRKSPNRKKSIFELRNITKLPDSVLAM